MTQISSLQRLAAFSNGAEFVDIYERFVDENGDYASYGPDLNGQEVQVRKSDGIHFTRAGSDKVAFYVEQALKRFYRGGTMSLEVVDLLAGTDAEHMLRPPLPGTWSDPPARSRRRRGVAHRRGAQGGDPLIEAKAPVAGSASIPSR